MSDARPLIFVVDDDSAVARGLKRLLCAWEMRVRTFGSGIEFLEAAKRSGPPDCSVIDIRMPGMTGLELQEAMRRCGIHSPVIFITAHPDPDVEERALKAGAVGFLEKPFSDDVLVRLIRQAVEAGHIRNPDGGTNMCEGPGK